MRKYILLGVLVSFATACSDKNNSAPPPPVSGTGSGLQILSVNSRLSPLEVTWDAPSGMNANYLVEKCNFNDCAATDRNDCCEPFMTVACSAPANCEVSAPYAGKSLPGNFSRMDRGSSQRFNYVDPDSEMDLGYTMRVRSYRGTQFGPWLEAR